MKDRNKMLNDILMNVLQIIPSNKDTLKAIIEDYNTMHIFELEITLNVRKLELEN